jgi:hypothetical protein
VTSALLLCLRKLQLTKQTCGQFKNLYLDTEIGQLDCLSFVDGLGDYSQVKRESELIEVEEMKVRVLSLNALIKSKKLMNRTRDKEAVLQLEAIKKLKNSKTFCRKGRPFQIKNWLKHVSHPQASLEATTHRYKCGTVPTNIY